MGKVALDIEDGGKSAERSERLEKVSPEIFLKVDSVDLTLKKNGGTKLLDGVDADFAPGEMAAVMGPSGAGKTTLFNVCAARIQSSDLAMTKGAVYANGVKVERTSDFSRWGTVAPQDDVVLPALTVFESLDYAARLRGSKEGRVEVLITTFELDERRDLAAGRLSGGQRKRLSIAMELVHAPSVILVDEPTSGLDSRVAFQVVKTLGDLARKTKTNVAATIHQPSVEAFLCFDRLTMLTAGRVAFRGSVPKACDIYRETVKGSLFAAAAGDDEEDEESSFLVRNPADCAIDRASQVDAALKAWEQLQSEDGDFRSAEEARLARYEALARSEDVVAEGSTAAALRKPSKVVAFRVLFQRTLVQSFRLQGTFQMKSAVMTSLVYGLVFFQQQNTQARVNLKLAILFLSLLMNGLVPGIVMVLFVPLERPTLRREAWNGVWKLSEYLAARTAAAAIVHFVAVTFYAVVIYYMVGFLGDFGDFLWPLAMLGCITQQLGLCLGSVFAAAVSAVPAFLPINIGSVIFAGFFFQKRFLTKDAQKVTYPFWFLSWYRYVFALLVTNEFEHGNFDACDVTVGDECPYVGFADFLGQRHVPRKVVAADVLKVDMPFAKRWHWLILLAFFFGMYAITFLMISKITLKP